MCAQPITRSLTHALCIYAHPVTSTPLAGYMRFHCAHTHPLRTLHQYCIYSMSLLVPACVSHIARRYLLTALGRSIKYAMCARMRFTPGNIHPPAGYTPLRLVPIYARTHTHAHIRIDSLRLWCSRLTSVYQSTGAILSMGVCAKSCARECVCVYQCMVCPAGGVYVRYISTAYIRCP